MAQSNGLNWLDGKKWSEVTRDERFFCAVLYEHARKAPDEFAHWVIEKTGLELDPVGPWDLGYEACFYRDYLWMKGHSIGGMKDFPPKRTFDLCLFGPNAIIIIEAKVCEPFGAGQNDEFARDKDLIKKLPGLENISVCTIALATTDYFENAGRYGRAGTLDVFEKRHITWAEVAGKYGDDLLARADRMYKLKPGVLAKD